MRLIDADALVKDGYVLHRIYQQDAKTMVYETKRIEDIPTAQPELKWIPCSERLPGLGQRVLLSKDGFISVGQLVRRGRGSQYEWSCNYNNWEGWMPLPEPFMEEGEK